MKNSVQYAKLEIASQFLTVQTWKQSYLILSYDQYSMNDQKFPTPIK